VSSVVEVNYCGVLVMLEEGVFGLYGEGEGGIVEFLRSQAFHSGGGVEVCTMLLCVGMCIWCCEDVVEGCFGVLWITSRLWICPVLVRVL
jgi:hypothetical protein